MGQSDFQIFGGDGTLRCLHGFVIIYTYRLVEIEKDLQELILI